MEPEGKPPLDLVKLAKICMRFGSDFPEERATAAALAENMLRAHGMTWEIVFEALQRSATRLAEFETAVQSRDWTPTTWHDPQSQQEAIEACLDWPEAMTAWEQGFLVSISGRNRLSAKQTGVLTRLVAKARAAAKAAGAL